MANSESRMLTAEVPAALAEKVDELSAKMERSRDWIVNQALITWVNIEDERDRLTREALADVDAGHVIDHQSVQAWADSLASDHELPFPTAS